MATPGADARRRRPRITSRVVVPEPGARFALGVVFVAVLSMAAYLAPALQTGLVVAALAWIGWLFGVVLLTLVAAEAFELLDLAFLGREGACPELPIAERPRPFVSLHVPICSEPPEVVGHTLRALGALRDADFEVLVVDNNTRDENLWRPVERLCCELGPRFRFFHLDEWPGYKAGALNFALAHTAPGASIVGVIDSDYEVASGFLAEMLPLFADDRVGFVQAPQDYREWERHYARRMWYWEYWQFFAVSMRLRRRRNAVLMHGTMVMMRKAALLEVGGWAEWCLTEDSELGLRLLAAGYRGVYCERTYGRGLVPFSYRAYLGQRRRWVVGGVQTIRRHWRLFMPWSGALTTAQKLHYLQGWAPWMRDGVLVTAFPLAVVLALISVVFAGTPDAVVPLSSATLVAVAYLAIRQLVVYGPYLRRPWPDALGAALAIFAMIPTVGLAWLRGWTRAPIAFHRTPKQPQPRAASLLGCARSMGLAAAMLAVAIAMLVRFGGAAAQATAGLMAYAVICLASVSAQLVDRD
jgi:cellulose synthase/poly-beta-1,6-N-acetylglucosamine synthase-like glycosyltransferase